LESTTPLAPHATSAAHWLQHWADETPERIFLAERDGHQWNTLTYRQARESARNLGQVFLDAGLSTDRPLMVLSGNSLKHALWMLGAFWVGIPIVPISPAYSLRSDDHAKLKHLTQLVQPGRIAVANPKLFADALTAIGCTPEHTLSHAQPEPVRSTARADAAFDALTPDTVAKILFTSGSTGEPKGVLNTHRMLTSNQQMIAQTWPFLEKTPPVLVDWLPWNHTFGGNHNFNLILRNGGSLWLDEGKPTPDLVGRTVANLKHTSPTLYFNVPAGFRALLPYLETDADLRASFFKDLKLIFYAGAALSQDLWERLERVSLQATGERVLLTSAWGATETAPMATSAHFPLDEAGVIGVPAPGVQLKLTPVADQLEMRVKGPNVTPGYLKRPDWTSDAFDDEGFYCTGDAGKLADPNNPNAGVLFCGRTAEDFKLSTGTWVHAGRLRLGLLEACAPHLQDVVLTGHDRAFLGALAWLAPHTPEDVVDQLHDALADWNARARGSSERIRRLLLMREPARIDANEITDKGYVNQGAVVRNRHHLVHQIYEDWESDQVRWEAAIK